MITFARLLVKLQRPISVIGNPFSAPLQQLRAFNQLKETKVQQAKIDADMVTNISKFSTVGNNSHMAIEVQDFVFPFMKVNLSQLNLKEEELNSIREKGHIMLVNNTQPKGYALIGKYKGRKGGKELIYVDDVTLYNCSSYDKEKLQGEFTKIDKCAVKEDSKIIDVEIMKILELWEGFIDATQKKMQINQTLIDKVTRINSYS